MKTVITSAGKGKRKVGGEPTCQQPLPPPGCAAADELGWARVPVIRKMELLIRLTSGFPVV